MLEMFLYGISIMYTPGPVVLLSINQGLNQRFKQSIGFFIGVGVAMFVLLLLYGYTGQQLIKPSYLIYISLIGSAYILYLAFKMFKHRITINEEKSAATLSFKDGFLMQFFNPKASLAALPIATIHFPSNNITGIKLAIVSAIFMIIVFGSPALYCLLGQFFSKLIRNSKALTTFNRVMACILVYIAFVILKDHVVLVLMGINAY